MLPSSYYYNNNEWITYYVRQQLRFPFPLQREPTPDDDFAAFCVSGKAENRLNHFDLPFKNESNYTLVPLGRLSVWALEFPDYKWFRFVPLPESINNGAAARERGEDDPNTCSNVG